MNSRGAELPSLGVLLGGFDPPTRAEDIAAGRRPSNDVTILQDRLGGVVYDFAWLEERLEATRRGRAMLRLVRGSGQWSLALAVVSAREIRHFDAVYVSGEDVAIYACALGRFRRNRRPGFVVRFERASYGRTKVRRAIHRRMLAVASRGIDVAICRTAGVAAQLEHSTEMPADRIWAFGQEIDVSFFDPAGAQPRLDQVREPYVLSAGLEHRNYTTLLHAVAELDCNLVIAAGSPWSKDAFEAGAELPAGTIVASFGPTEMRSLYAHAAVVALSVHPTERACGMNVIGEAWAMARPVVASRTAGLQEFITPDVDGVMVPPGDTAAIRDALNDLLATPSDADRIGAAGRQTAVDSLSLRCFEETVRRALDTVSGAESPTHDR